MTGGSRTACAAADVASLSGMVATPLLTEPERICSADLRGPGRIRTAKLPKVVCDDSLARHRCWIYWPYSLTSAGDRRQQRRGNRDTGCSRRCANMRRRSSANPLRPGCAGTGSVLLHAMAAERDSPANRRHGGVLASGDRKSQHECGIRVESGELRPRSRMAVATSCSRFWLPRGRIKEGGMVEIGLARRLRSRTPSGRPWRWRGRWPERHFRNKMRTTESMRRAQHFFFFFLRWQSPASSMIPHCWRGPSTTWAASSWDAEMDDHTC